MFYNDPISNRIFSQSHRTLTQGTFIFGGILFFLAILIFAYPMLIVYFIAGLILLAGISVLTIAWKLWQVRKSVSQFEYRETPLSINRGPRVIYFRWYG
ncbi:MAG: hypothetical protein HOF21_00305 [Nitrospina sp.]|nr:hypothetical protein [Nitrospina sp.]MBT5632430.1 hypothetical protein [Nitrospina sp.]